MSDNDPVGKVMSDAFLKAWRGFLNDVDELQNKVKALEEWKKENTDHEDYIRLVKTFSERICGLEEWKDRGIREAVRDSYENNKLVDKKVWEEIKAIVSGLTYFEEKDRLVQAIKKVDPAWCPND